MKVLNTKAAILLKRGRGVHRSADCQRLKMCGEPCESTDKEAMNELINKLGNIKIVNPMKASRAKKETKSKFIFI